MVELPRRPTTANRTSAPSRSNSRRSRTPSRTMLVLNEPASPRSPVINATPTIRVCSRSCSSFTCPVSPLDASATWRVILRIA
jgi:hypothetical protein